jgi:hypothetical protein
MRQVPRRQEVALAVLGDERRVEAGKGESLVQRQCENAAEDEPIEITLDNTESVSPSPGSLSPWGRVGVRGLD